jgi:hypothetical protein
MTARTLGLMEMTMAPAMIAGNATNWNPLKKIRPAACSG